MQKRITFPINLLNNLLNLYPTTANLILLREK
jgi:hypothetical protein